MRLDRVAAELRPRSAWESVDLGVAMWQRWARDIYVAWSFLVLPLCLVLLVALRGVDFAPRTDFTPEFAFFGIAAWWFWTVAPVWALLWWLTPLFQRIVLHVLSRALFGDPPRLIDSLRAAPRLLGRHVLLALFAHRLRPSRTLIQPVAQLEELRGSERRKRERLLASRLRGDAWLSSMIASAFMLSTSVAGLVILMRFLPRELLPDLEPLESGDLVRFEPGWLTHAARALVVASYTLIAPLDAAIGFGLYVSRRTQLEGWDVEVAFRRVAERIGGLARSKRTQAAVLLVAALACIARPARAQESEPQGEEVERAIERVLASDDFGSRRDVESWRFDWTSDEEEPKAVPKEQADDSKSRSNLDRLGFLATLFELVLWTVVIGLAMFLSVVVAKRVGWLDVSKRGAPQVQRPTHVLGLDVRPQSLPADIPAAARALWARGDAVGALALLYRGAISRLVERDGLQVADSDTEGDCLRRARALPDTQRVDYFGVLTRAWQTCAYSSARPTEGEVERLCTDWSLRFERATA